MMIRLSVNNDKDGIISLWQEAFGDKKEDIQFFLDNKYVPQNTLICELDGEIASMLFLLEGDMYAGGKDYPSYYLYAACTAVKLRGKGIMAALLDFAKKIADERNKYFICLMPAEQSLFYFYARYGYKPVFKQKVLTVFREETESFSDKSLFECDLSDICVAECRNNAFKEFDYFKWDNQSIEFAFKHNALYSGKVLPACNGYAIYAESSNAASVKELAFTEDNFENAIKNLFVKTNCDKISVKLPADYTTTIGKCEIVESAMMLPINKNAEIIMNGINNAYIGLTLD